MAPLSVNCVRACLLSVCGLLLLAGCADSAPQVTAEAAAADGLINTICPIMGGEAQADVAVDWNGKKVGFCCPPCIEEWAELSEEEKVRKLASAEAKPHGDHGDAHGDHGTAAEPAAAADSSAAAAPEAAAPTTEGNPAADAPVAAPASE